jgi:hypothetical protein
VTHQKGKCVPAAQTQFQHRESRFVEHSSRCLIRIAYNISWIRPLYCTFVLVKIKNLCSGIKPNSSRNLVTWRNIVVREGGRGKDTRAGNKAWGQKIQSRLSAVKHASVRSIFMPNCVLSDLVHSSAQHILLLLAGWCM